KLAKVLKKSKLISPQKWLRCQNNLNIVSQTALWGGFLCHFCRVKQEQRIMSNQNIAYQRILLKLSGEALQGSEGFGIDANVIDRIAGEIKELVQLGVQVGIVIGGGNLFRGAGLAKAGMNRVVGDHM